MTMLRYNIHVGENGSVLIPTTPFAVGDEIEVVLRGANEEVEKLKQGSSPVGNVGSAVRISDLWGVGAEIWQEEGVDEYIRKERDSWD